MKIENICIIEAQPSDYEAITNISIEVWRHAYQGMIDPSFLETIDSDKWLNGRIQWLSHPDRYAIVAKIDHAIVGFCEFGVSTRAEYGPGEVYALYIRPQYQKQGIGKKLMQAAQCRLQDEALMPCIVIALEKNSAARHFYEKLGFDFVAKSSHKIGGVEYATNIYRRVLYTPHT